MTNIQKLIEGDEKTFCERFCLFTGKEHPPLSCSLADWTDADEVKKWHQERTAALLQEIREGIEKLEVKVVRPEDVAGTKTAEIVQYLYVEYIKPSLLALLPPEPKKDFFKDTNPHEPADLPPGYTDEDFA